MYSHRILDTICFPLSTEAIGLGGQSARHDILSSLVRALLKYGGTIFLLLFTGSLKYPTMTILVSSPFDSNMYLGYNMDIMRQSACLVVSSITRFSSGFPYIARRWVRPET